MRSFSNSLFHAQARKISHEECFLVVAKIFRFIGIRIWFIYLYGGFLKWWYPTTIGFPTKKMIILGCFGGTTIWGNTHMMPVIIINRSWLQAAGNFGSENLTWKSREFPSQHWFYVVHDFCFLQKSSLVNYEFTAVFRIDLHCCWSTLGRDVLPWISFKRCVSPVYPTWVCLVVIGCQKHFRRSNCQSMARVVHMNGIQVKFRQMGSFYFLEEQARQVEHEFCWAD